MVSQLRCTGAPGCQLIQVGIGKIFLIFWVMLHVVGLGLAILHYQMKDNLDGARQAFGWTFGQLSSSPYLAEGKLNAVVLARGSAQILHSQSAVHYRAMPAELKDQSMSSSSYFRYAGTSSHCYDVHPSIRSSHSTRTSRSIVSPSADRSDDEPTEPVEQVAWAIVFFSVIHTAAHIRNFVSYRLPHEKSRMKLTGDRHSWPLRRTGRAALQTFA